jgi:hypothetical protein
MSSENLANPRRGGPLLGDEKSSAPHELNPPKRAKAALVAVTETVTQELRQPDAWFVEGVLRGGNSSGFLRCKPDPVMRPISGLLTR